MNDTPGTLGDYIRAIRGGLVCDRCGRYIGSLAETRYLPPPYPIALASAPENDEAAAIAGFEWHMLGLLRQRKFTLRHPQSKGRCVSVREWYAEQHEDDDAQDANDDGDV